MKGWEIGPTETASGLLNESTDQPPRADLSTPPHQPPPKAPTTMAFLIFVAIAAALPALASLVRL